MEILAILNQKGGVAKTSTASAIGAGLKLKGYRVLFVDLDAQCNLSDIAGASTDGVTVFELLTRKAVTKDAIQSTEQGDIIPASVALAMEGILTATGKEYRLKEALEPVKGCYDYIIIDCPPSLGVLTINALTASTSCIIPAQADKFSLQAIEQFRDTYSVIKRYTNPNISIMGVLITRYSNRAILSRDYSDMIEELATTLNTKLFKVKIRECIAVKEAQALQKDIFTYSPKSNATADYSELVEEIIERSKHNG